MKAFKTMIKLKNIQVNEIKVILSQLNEKRAKLDESIKQIKQDIINEEKFAAARPELIERLSFYINQANVTIEILQGAMGQLDKQIDDVLEDIRAKHLEKKQFEILLAQKIEKQKLEQNKKLREASEEASIIRFAREHTQ